MGPDDLSDSDHELVLQIFVASAEEGLASMEQALLTFDANPNDEAALQEIFRTCHTLKGDALTLGLDVLASIAHALEDIFDRLRSGRARLDQAQTSLLLTALDALRSLVADAQGNIESDPGAYASLLNRLHESLGGSDATTGERPESAATHPGGATVDLGTSIRRRTFRVRVETVDRLLDLTGELAIARSRINQILGACDAGVPAELFEAHDALDHLSLQLEQEVMKIRMVSVDGLFKQHLRTLRDAAVTLGKRVRLRAEGGETELDTAVVENLREPLGHMIRNAIAHGIESAEEREARGKDPCGTVTLRAWHEGGTVVVEVEDDGGGLDLDRIRQRAVERGLIGRAEDVSDAEAAALVFQPGFTTAPDTTLSAGRGVGMDVVRTRVEAIHGSVSIRTRPWQGTTVTARLPLTLAIIQGFAVGVGDEVYVIPLNSVSECIDLPERERHTAARAGVIELRESSLPFVRLASVLGVQAARSEREKIVVIRNGTDRVGLCVDGVFGESQAVIKRLDRSCGALPGIAGSTILGTGDVALVVDVASLMRLIRGDAAGADGLDDDVPDRGAPEGLGSQANA